jgi:CHAT domain-containing protein
MSDPFCIDWFGGPSAQLEIFSPAVGAAAQLYQLKYTPAFRSTIRPPLKQLFLGKQDLQPVEVELDRVAQGTYGASRHGAGGVVVPPSREAAKALLTAGQQLFYMVIPPYVQIDLRDRSLTLEIGVDEQLLSYPWELFHDGSDFLCLKHKVGRFVNGTAAPVQRVQEPWSDALDPLRVLIISVPNPQWDDGTQFHPLPEAVAETDAIIAAISTLPNVEVTYLSRESATFNEVFRELKSTAFHIIHFNGHAVLDPAEPRQSRLVLHNRGMTPAQITAFVGRRPPTLCFINACETAAMPSWNGQHNVFGIAQAFLETDSYLLGTRWKVSDRAAAAFAGRFYKAMLVEQKPVGQAVAESRLAARDVAPDDLGWASYVYYGDPRLWIHRVKRVRKRRTVRKNP